MTIKKTPPTQAEQLEAVLGAMYSTPKRRAYLLDIAKIDHKEGVDVADLACSVPHLIADIDSLLAWSANALNPQPGTASGVANLPASGAVAELLRLKDERCSLACDLAADKARLIHEALPCSCASDLVYDGAVNAKKELQTDIKEARAELRDLDAKIAEMEAAI